VTRASYNIPADFLYQLCFSS